jgi:hypothetical protein
MPQDPYEELDAALKGASDWGLTLSALGCIHRASAVLVAAGVVDESVAPFSVGSLVELGESRDISAVLRAVMSQQQILAIYAADPETGELPEETERADLLSMASELVLRANANVNRASIEEWSNFCTGLSGDITQQLDCMELPSVAEFDSRSPSPYEDIPPLPAWEIWTQLEILRLADVQDADALSQIAELSGALRSALLVIAAEAVNSGESD